MVQATPSLADGLHFSLALTLTHRKWGGSNSVQIKRVLTFAIVFLRLFGAFLKLQAVTLNL
jgi:hypothetical protein